MSLARNPIVIDDEQVLGAIAGGAEITETESRPRMKNEFSLEGSGGSSSGFSGTASASFPAGSRTTFSVAVSGNSSTGVTGGMVGFSRKF
jgi:hypothetical protein